MEQKEHTIGFGTWKITEADTDIAIETALECGYRHFDTAAAYGNERAIGEALRKSGVDREKIYISGKLWTTERDYEKVLVAC